MCSKPYFLALPPELRLLIYEALWTPLTLDISPRDGRLPASSLRSSAALNLLLACRQTYHEARVIAFSRHTFPMTRNLELNPLLYELPLEPMSHIRSLVIPGYRPPLPSSYAPTAALHSHLAASVMSARCYTFKEICSLVRRFPRLESIVILTDQLMEIARVLRSRKAHVNFRLKKARYMRDERFLPSYDLRMLDANGDEQGNGKGVRMGWRLEVDVGEEKARGCNLLVCGLAVE